MTFFDDVSSRLLLRCRLLSPPPVRFGLPRQATDALRGFHLRAYGRLLAATVDIVVLQAPRAHRRLRRQLFRLL